jgi:hypothetical protein
MQAWETDPAAFGPEDPDDDDDQGMEAPSGVGVGQRDEGSTDDELIAEE